MYPQVEDALFPFLRHFEGMPEQMYVDSRGLVTVGVGFMIEPVATAVGLGLSNWYVLPGQSGPIAPNTLAEEIAAVKRRDPDYQHRFGLRRDAMGPLCRSEGRLREGILRPLFPDFASFPADAQLGILAVSWLTPSVGGMTHGFPNFVAACQQRNWRVAGPESLWAVIRTATGDPLVNRRVQRRNAHLRLFDNAAAVEEGNRAAPGRYPLSRLWYPNSVPLVATAGGLGI